MGAKLAVAVAVLLVSIPAVAQVQPAAGPTKPSLINWSVGGGMDYMSGDFQNADINRWGPTVWATATMWHCLGVNAEGHSMIWGGNDAASGYKLFIGEGGLMCTMSYWGRLQPIFKGELGFASLSRPGNDPAAKHGTYSTWAAGGGLEYHIKGHWWTRVDYTYEGLMDFRGPNGEYNTLNPRGIAFGATYRFGKQGTRF